MKPYKFQNVELVIAALRTAKQAISSRSTDYVCNGLARQPEEYALALEISRALGNTPVIRGYPTVASWLINTQGITPNQEEIRIYRMAWIDSMIVNLQTNGTIYANP